MPNTSVDAQGRRFRAFGFGFALMWVAVPLPTAAAMPPKIDVVSSPVMRTVVVPPQLRTRVPRIELSGLAWSTALGRYLVVIDDSVDRLNGKERAPFVLALDPAGALDVQPVPIDGIDALDDAEGMTAAGGDTFYLLTSHARSEHGRLRKSRRQLLQLRLVGRRLRATGSLDLLDPTRGLGPVLKQLGLAEDVAVDLEGLTFHEGALYIGVKAPLLPTGAALILKLAEAEQAFANTDAKGPALSVWGKVDLSVPALPGTGPVSQGIADLVFTPDDALYLVGNSPKGWPHDGGGALWRIDHPKPGEPIAIVTRRFPSLKPEGIALDAEGTGLTLVFDRNTHEPLWMTWPLTVGRERPVAGKREGRAVSK